MKTNARKTTQLGEVVATAYDVAAQCSMDPEEVSRIAIGVVTSMLRHARRVSPSRRPRS